MDVVVVIFAVGGVTTVAAIVGNGADGGVGSIFDKIVFRRRLFCSMALRASQ